MNNLDNIHSASRSAVYKGFEEEGFNSSSNVDRKKLNEASRVRNFLIEAQEREFSIFKELFKNEMKVDLPWNEKIFTAIGSHVVKQMTPKELFQMQGDQLGTLEKISEGTELQGVKDEFNRLINTWACSIINNRHVKNLATDPEGLKKDCKKIFENRQFFLFEESSFSCYRFDVPEKSKEVSYAVLRNSSIQAELEVRNERVLGIRSVSCSPCCGRRGNAGKAMEK